MRHGRHEQPDAHFTPKRLVGLLQPYGGTILVVLTCVGVGAALALVPPYLTSLMIDRGILGHDPALLLELVGPAAASAVGMGVVGLLQSYLTNAIGQRLMADLREASYAHLLRLSLRFFGAAEVGDLLTRFTSDIGGIQLIFYSSWIPCAWVLALGVSFGG